APFLRDRFTAAHSTTLFSATLSPQHYHADLLGLPADTQWLDVESPFSAEQLQVRFVSNLSSRYQDRARSLLPIAQVMAQQVRERPGHSLALFSSYAYLQQVLDTFQTSSPEIPVREQSRQMSEAQREAFLEGFTDDSRCIG